MSQARPPLLSLFFPAYNEAANLPALLREAAAAASRLTPDYELIVVDDGSRDNTARVVEEVAASDPRLRLIRHERNQGYGAAILSGLRAARGRYVFFSDADRQFDLKEISKLWPYVPAYGAVLGYRAPRRDSWPRLLNAWGWNRLNRWLFGLRVRDIDCAFKLFDQQVLEGLELKSRGAMLSAELLIRLKRRGVIFREVPVTHSPRQVGVATGAKPAVILRAFRELISIYRHELGDGRVGQALRFGVVGVINTLVDLVLYFWLTRFVAAFATSVVVAKAVSFFAGTVSSFILNRRWTFGLTDAVKASEVARFYAVIGSSLLLNVGSTYFLIREIGFYDLIAVVVATVITFVWGFLWSRQWVFRRDSAGHQASLNLAMTTRR